MHIRWAVVAVLAVLAGCGNDPVPPARSAVAPGTLAPSTLAGSASAPASSAAAQPAAAQPAANPLVIPAGVTAGIVVFDRQTGGFTYEQNAAMRFRSASLVKLLIVLDHLWGSSDVPAGDRARLDLMLRASDDAAATYFWRRNGSRAVVTRMAARLSLTDTAPPPAAQPGYWGFTALSAADVVRVYRHLLDSTPVPVRDYVLGNLRGSARCGTDRYDQSFGIPSAFAKPWAVKQGWSGFGDRPATPCAVSASVPLVAAQRAPVVDMAGEVLHTTGVVGAADRAVVAVLSVHPDGTPYARATADLTALVRSLTIPGATPAS